jgi:hypothetical protein
MTSSTGGVTKRLQMAVHGSAKNGLFKDGAAVLKRFLDNDLQQIGCEA